MDTETNWHRITAALLRENERLQKSLDQITEKYDLVLQEVQTLRDVQPTPAVLPGGLPDIAADVGIDTGGSEDEDESEEEEYVPSETEVGLYWTDREYVTDDELETGSEDTTEDQVPEVKVEHERLAPIQAAGESSDPLIRETVDELEEEEEEEGAGGHDYVPSETESELYWTDREYITDDAWETESDEALDAEVDGSRPATPAAIETPGLPFSAVSINETPQIEVEISPRCFSTRALHHLHETPSRFVPRNRKGVAFAGDRGE